MSNSTAQLLKNNPEAKRFFDTLPEFVRETIMQTKSNITDLEELKSCAQNICKKAADK